MTREMALRVIRDLSKEFGVTGIALAWNARVRNGSANGWRITLGPRCWRTVEQSLIHEFAHAVHIQRRWTGKHRERTGHGPIFYQTLVAVAQAYFGDSRRYHWFSEYKAVYNRARRDGLVTVERNCRRSAVEAAIAAGARSEEKENHGDG